MRFQLFETDEDGTYLTKEGEQLWATFILGCFIVAGFVGVQLIFG